MPFVEFPDSDLEASIPSRFERHAALAPDRLAVRFLGESLTYRELDRRANRIANAILTRPGRSPDPVVVLLRQGTGLIAAILGVLKAGRIYVPLDPAHPPARLGQTLGEAGAGLLICETSTLGAAREGVEHAGSDLRCQVVVLDELLDQGSSDAPGTQVPPDATAYIYYTSGSTGRPKGVFDSHRNVLHNIQRYTNALRICREDRLTLLQGPAFSGAVSSMFGALLNGAALFPYDVPSQGIGAPMADWIRREALTMYHSVPMLFRSILTGATRFPSIRVIRLEGDASAPIDLELFRRHFSPPTMLVNGLGTTETGIACQYFVSPTVTASDSPSIPQSVVPIGFATSGMEVMVLDEAGQREERLVAGEIAIRSRYLALGYWRQPELTRKAFLPDPDGGDRRIYRTGDLGRFRTDGALEYLGRRDGGAKILGQRVEPAEVEAALLRIKGVRQAAVVIRPDHAGTPSLQAFLVGSDTARPAPAEIRRELRSILPAPMIPSRFGWLDRLPYSENGKVERAALPDIETLEDDAEWERLAPRNETEQRLLALFEEALGRKGIGIRDDFFELGGDSIRAIGILTALTELADWELPPSALLDAPTVEQLASVLDREGLPDNPSMVPIRPRGSRPPFFLVHAHTGEATRCGELSRMLGPDQPMYGLQALGWSGRHAAHENIEDMAAHYVREIRKVQPEGPRLLGGICFGGIVALEMAQQFHAAGEKVSLVYLLFNTPSDFPGLVPTLAEHRSRLRIMAERAMRHPISARILAHAAEMKGQSLIGKIRHVVALGGRMLERVGKKPPPNIYQERAARLTEVNRRALERYRPRPYPGRVTLVLEANHRHLYSSDPSREFGSVAEGYDWTFIGHQDGQIYFDPAVRVLAAHLNGALDAAVADAPLTGAS